jgi:hypothetical protein
MTDQARAPIFEFLTGKGLHERGDRLRLTCPFFQGHS